jgi:hypothetical protein
VAPQDLTTSETWPYGQTGAPRPLDAPVDHEPPRHGEGGEDCAACERPDESFLWVDDDTRLELFELVTGPPVASLRSPDLVRAMQVRNRRVPRSSAPSAAPSHPRDVACSLLT